MNRFGDVLSRTVQPLAAEFRFRHAFNGVVLRLDPDEVDRIAGLPGVNLIEGYGLLSDTSPRFIGATGRTRGFAPPGPMRGSTA